MSKQKLTSLNLEDALVQQIIENLACKLQISIKANDPLTVLRAIELLICEDVGQSGSAEEDKGSFHFNLNHVPLGFEPNDKVLDQCAAIMRLLYIKDLRKLQTQINQIISESQLITADPKTDSKLAKIGF
ncbi:hypothetical protein ACOME3_008106 [Neoechinorhynchus agilis]